MTVVSFGASRSSGLPARKTGSASPIVVLFGKSGQQFHQPSPQPRSGEVRRGKTSAKKQAKVRPQPLRCPRLEQNTRWPRKVWPSVALGSLPSERLCRFEAPTQPHCDRATAWGKKLRVQLLGVADKMKRPMEHPDLLPENQGPRPAFFTALQDGGTRFGKI